MRKPRTVTGRVASRLLDALLGPAVILHDGKISRKAHGREHERLMYIAAQATQQGLDPDDFDNANGIDAFEAIAAALPNDPTKPFNAFDDFILLTAAWRRVVVSARRQRQNCNGYTWITPISDARP